MSAAANVFFDTEFSGLAVARPQLISLALVSEDGRELYLELDGVDPAACSPFVRECVLPLLDGNPVSRESAALAVRDYLRSFGTRVNLWTDGADYDLALLSSLTAGTPIPLLRVCRPEFGSVACQSAYERALGLAYADGPLRRHHALGDAKALRAAWIAARKVAPRQIHAAIARAPHPKA